MLPENLGPVWVPRSIKNGVRIGLAGALFCALAASAVAQPLQGGVSSADGRHYFLDDGKVRSLSSQFAGDSTFASGVSGLWQGATGWGSSFLIADEEGLKRVDTTAADLSAKLLVPGKELQVRSWGENFVVFSDKGKELWLITPLAEASVKLDGALKAVEPINPARLLVHTDKELSLLLAPTGSGLAPRLQPLTLPFPKEQARIASGDGQVVVWSPNSKDALRWSGTGEAQKLQLVEPPSLGVRPLPGGYLVVLGTKQLAMLNPEGRAQSFPRPSKSTETSLASWTMAPMGRHLLLLVGEDNRTRSFLFGGAGVPSALLPTGSLKGIVAPAPGSSGSTLIFLETSLDEDKLDERGRLVLDLESGKPARRVITGHQIFAVEQDGRMSQLASEPRTALLGPVERVGERALYATQTEPPRTSGQKLAVDARYPQPPVILHGRSLGSPADAWSFEMPRGQGVSRDRLPESHWPRLGADGPILVTSEDGALLALGLDDGKQIWSSPKLPMDESSPLMLEWKDGLGLVSARGTGRTFTGIDTADGSEKASLSLTPLFSREKWRHLLGVITVCAALGYYIYAAGRRTLYIRKIAGLQALDEAVGRATEMGKPVLYVVGLADVDDIQTMASLSILSHVARKTAEYDTPIVTTTARAVAFSAAQEIVRDAFSVAGRPDAFSVESVRYISDDQFGYTAGVDGIMVREKPAANFYIGNFYAESLILAETGHATGSIQIAGTAQPSQVPFFVAACDYTLIGEELFAASAYLSRDPLQVGSLRGQDVGKAIVMALLVVCSVLVSLGLDWSEVSAWIHQTTGVLLP